MCLTFLLLVKDCNIKWPINTRPAFSPGAAPPRALPELSLITWCVCESHSVWNHHNQLKNSNLKNSMWFLRDFSKYEIKYRLIRLSLKPSNIIKINYQKLETQMLMDGKLMTWVKWKRQVRPVTPKHTSHADQTVGWAQGGPDLVLGEAWTSARASSIWNLDSMCGGKLNISKGHAWSMAHFLFYVCRFQTRVYKANICLWNLSFL